ncbi:MAG: hypothetical protein KDD41_11625 [Flavobacteriales bacterium]|nr:hypothetical protein [Flavobacteriales bacterium]
MSKIDKNNYEAYLLDYLEGNLSPELRAELLLFFEAHPELREDLDEFELFTIAPEPTSFAQKESLKVEEDRIGIINYEEALIGEIEGENSPETSAGLAAFLQAHPEKQAELEAYQKTRLIAPAITFNDKAALKQKEDRVIPLYWWYSAAAAVILALFLLKGINWNEEQVELPIAEEKIEQVEPAEEQTVPIKDQLLANESNSEKAEETKQQNGTVAPNQQLPKKQTPEDVQPNVREIEEQDNLYANTPDAQHQDTVIAPKDELPPVAEEELFTDNVKIIYEEEAGDHSADSAQQATPNKVSRLRLLREVFASKVKDKMLDEKTNNDGEVVAYALNVGPFNFTRNRKEK